LANYSPPSHNGFYAVGDTRVRLVNSVFYWLWVVRDLNTGRLVAVRLSEGKSCLDIILLFKSIRLEEVKEVLHVDGPWYNVFSSLTLTTST
jgi:transposase